MFKFLKKLFGAEEEQIEKKRLEVAGLVSFLLERENEVKKEIDYKLNTEKEKLDSEIKKINESIEALKTAQLRNPNVTEREKHFMEGNREAYIRSLNQLLGVLRLEKVSHENAVEISRQIREQLELFAKNSARQFMILREFFANELKNIAISIQSIEQASKNIKKVVQESVLDKIKDIRDDLGHLENKIAHLKEIREDLKEEKKKFKEFTEKKETISKKLDETKNSKGFAELKELEQRRDKLKEKIKEKESGFVHNITAMEAALKKYERITLDYQKLINGYIKNPIDTLVKDKNHELLTLLEKMKKAIQKNEIDLKDKKKEKTLYVIEKVDKNYLEEISDEYLKLREELDRLIRGVEKSPINREVMGLKIDLEDVEEKIALIRINNMENKVGSEEKSIIDLKNKIERRFKSGFGQELDLIFEF